jgi:hypothetical protein
VRRDEQGADGERSKTASHARNQATKRASGQAEGRSSLPRPEWCKGLA